MINLRNPDMAEAHIKIKNASSLSPFTYGLEYSSPARGTWNIVHTGMLLPESHQIFVCAQNCLRGVVLTAAELGVMNRFSTISVDEDTVLTGNCEEIIINGVSDIVEKLPVKPKAILIFTSCVHKFLNSDLDLVYKTLRKKYPDIGFVECYMTPIMRKSGLPPDPTMRRQLYYMLQPSKDKSRAVNFIGNNFATDESSELLQMIRRGGYEIMDICNCKTFSEYEKMSQSCLNISNRPEADAAAKELEKRLSIKHLYLPVSFDFNEISENLHMLSKELSIPLPDIDALKEEAINSLRRASQALKNMTIAIDYTATGRPFGMAKLLLQYGFNVTTVYGDIFSDEEQKDFEWLQKNRGDLELIGTIHHQMAVLPRNAAVNQNGKILAIGQKAAYFTGTKYFVNIVEDGGLYGFNGICKLMDLMVQASTEEKDAQKLIVIKGLRCCV